MKTFEQYFHDSGTGGYPLRTILDNLTDEEIEDSVKEYAQDYARSACEDLRERIAKEARIEVISFAKGFVRYKKHDIKNTEIILP